MWVHQWWMWVWHVWAVGNTSHLLFHQRLALQLFLHPTVWTKRPGATTSATERCDRWACVVEHMAGQPLWALIIKLLEVKLELWRQNKHQKWAEENMELHSSPYPNASPPWTRVASADLWAVTRLCHHRDVIDRLLSETIMEEMPWLVWIVPVFIVFILWLWFIGLGSLYSSNKTKAFIKLILLDGELVIGYSQPKHCYSFQWPFPSHPF